MAALPPWLVQPVDPALAGAPVGPPWPPTTPEPGTPPAWMAASGAPTPIPPGPPPVDPALAGGPGAAPPLGAPPPEPPPPYLAGEDAARAGTKGPAWEVDAVSGADTGTPARPPMPDEKRGVGQPGEPGQRRPQTFADVVAGGIEEQGRLEGAQADARAKGLRDRAEAGKKLTQMDMLAEADRRTDLAQRRAQLDADLVDLKNTQIKDTWLADRTLGQKVLLGMGALFGGALSVTTGQPNPVLQIAADGIERDLAIQKANLANRWKGQDAQESAYARLYDYYKDTRVADAMFSARMLDGYADDALAEAAKYDSPIIQQKAQMAAMQFRQASAAQADAAALAQQQQAEEMRLKRSQVAQGWSRIAEDKRQFDASLDEKAKERDAKANAALAAMTEEQRRQVVSGPNGQPIIDPASGQPLRIEDDTERKEFGAKMRAYAAYRTALEDYYEDVKKVGRVRRGWAQSGDATRLASKRGNLFNAWRKMAGAGTIDAGSIKAFEELVPPPNGWITGYDPVSGVEATMEATDQAIDSDMRYYKYAGSWSADYKNQVPLDEGATSAAGNQQGKKREMPWFIDDQGQLNQEGRGRTATDAEVAAHQKATQDPPWFTPDPGQTRRVGVGPY